jgi:Putative Actinobacterial Holin-X, holin superfamily III
MDQRTDERSIGQLFSDLSRQLSTLVRQEIALARVEMTSRVTSAGRGAAMVGAGGALVYAGALAVVAAIVLLLIQGGIDPWLAALIVGIVIAAIGGVLVMTGRSTIASTDLTPRRTIETIRDDTEWAKEQTK